MKKFAFNYDSSTNLCNLNTHSKCLNITVMIFNSIGQNIKELNEKNVNALVINMQEFSEGLYYLFILTDKNYYIEKVFKN